MKRLVTSGNRRKLWMYLPIAAALMVAVSFSVFGDVSGEHGESIESVLQDIQREQGVDRNEAIDPDRVSERSLERLGEAVMSVMHPDPRQHELMDEMMGGEGSESLEYMHRMMGYRYLAGLSGRGDWGGMMGGRMWGSPGMMGGHMWGGHGMMGGSGRFGGGGWWPPGTGRAGFVPGGAGPGLFLGLRVELDLSESQVRQLREYRDSLIESSTGLRGKLRKTYAVLSDLLTEEQVDLQRVERQVREIESIRGDLHLATIRAEVQAWNTLTERQREEMRSRADWRGVGRGSGGPKTGLGAGGRGMMGGGMMGY